MILLSWLVLVAAAVCDGIFQTIQTRGASKEDYRLPDFFYDKDRNLYSWGKSAAWWGISDAWHQFQGGGIVFYGGSFAIAPVAFTGFVWRTIVFYAIRDIVLHVATPRWYNIQIPVIRFTQAQRNWRLGKSRMGKWIWTRISPS